MPTWVETPAANEPAIVGVVTELVAMTEPKPKRRRRWYQFSLRSLVLFTVVCAVGAAWVGWELEKTRREQLVVAKIEALGGAVWYHGIRGPDRLVWYFRKVRVVDLCDTPVTDADLAPLKALTNLEGLVLGGTPVTDAVLEHLKGLPNLGRLYIEDTQVTAGGVKELQRALPNCTIYH